MMHDAYLGSTARQGKYGECTGRMTGCSSRGNGGAALFDSQTSNVLDEPRDIPWISLNPYRRWIIWTWICPYIVTGMGTVVDTEIRYSMR